MMIHQIDFFGFPMKIIESESIDKDAMLLVSGYPVDDFGKPLEGDDFREWVRAHVIKLVHVGKPLEGGGFWARVRAHVIKLVNVGNSEK